ncbi:uncharacterized protein LOC110990380 [Acanthaster planci]|uniref:Uncharacterized protein LOC110990380 n=1 Tax=Acanthaster planci TaxID=133434 RepID=A0A8B8A050_ACAPL|nr:uncharacterized protein LOC110990380 [Acanthaster planci]XP_022111049.1 uncharacterized protein LOC110990380 [Acanthaster planci]
MCCSCGSTRCRYRCLRCSGSLLVVIGVLYAAAGVLFNFFDFLQIFTAGHALIWGGAAMFMAGVASIFITKKMSDDDWSSRGTAFMCVLAIFSALANVALHTYNLYEKEYFQEYDMEAFAEQNLTYDLTYDLWLGVIIADAGIDFLALLATLAGLAAFGIGCCCSEYSEIVDDRKGRI